MPLTLNLSLYLDQNIEKFNKNCTEASWKNKRQIKKKKTPTQQTNKI
jgi:hypothetical protein